VFEHHNTRFTEFFQLLVENGEEMAIALLLMSATPGFCHGKFVLTSQAAATGVFGHPEIVKDQAYVTHELSHFLRDTAYAFGFDDANSESPQSSDVFRAVTVRMRLRSSS
jgi:hypothetical protein